MRVLFDDRPSVSCVTGIGRYSATVGALLARSHRHRVVRVTIGGGRACVGRPRGAADEALELPARLARERIDVLHSPLFHLPPLVSARVVVTVHDAIPAVRPDLTSPAFARLFEAEALAAVARADRVVCPSEHAAREVAAALDVPASRLRVVPEAPAPCFIAAAAPEAAASEAAAPGVAARERLAALRARLGLEAGPYVLAVGSLEPRKDPLALVDALARLAQGVRPIAVFAGPEGGIDVRGEADRRGLGAWVRVAGVVADEDLVALYRAAGALVFPSRAEGFGLPLLEAFATGAPVVAARAGAIPEVSGDAAVLVEPGDPDGLARALERVLEDAALAAELRARGARRLAERYAPDVVLARFEALYDELEAGVRVVE